MLGIDFKQGTNKGKKILCLGAHADDIEIGCGGTILRLLETHGESDVYWVVLGPEGQRASEAKKSAKAFLAEARSKQVLIKGFRDGYYPFQGERIKDLFEGVKKDFSPDMVFTHYRGDLHQDHRFISDLTWQTFRDNLILEYEIPKYDGDFGSPNFFVHLDETICEKKISNLMRSFTSRKQHRWFNEETFRATLRLRGVESNAPGRYAEAFYCRKIVY